QGQRHRRGCPGGGVHHHQRAVVANAEDQRAQRLERAGAGGGPLGGKLVDRASLHSRSTASTEAGQIAGERPLGHLEALGGEQFPEVFLGGDPASAEQALDGGTAGRAAGLLAGPHSSVTRVPTPSSVNSSAMVAWATRPSRTCTRGTPPPS